MAKYVRLADVVYSNGRAVGYDYGDASSQDIDQVTDYVMSRLSFIFDDSNADEKVEWDAQTEEFVTDDLLWALVDHQNSVRDLAEYDSATDTTAVVEHRVYDSYGNLSYESSAAIVCAFGYTGRYKDVVTGLQYNTNRWYDPSTRRWMSEDPAGITGGINLYEYVGDSPTNRSDPSGLQFVPGTPNSPYNPPNRPQPRPTPPQPAPAPTPKPAPTCAYKLHIGYGKDGGPEFAEPLWERISVSIGHIQMIVAPIPNPLWKVLPVIPSVIWHSDEVPSAKNAGFPCQCSWASSQWCDKICTDANGCSTTTVVWRTASGAAATTQGNVVHMENFGWQCNCPRPTGKPASACKDKNGTDTSELHDGVWK